MSEIRIDKDRLNTVMELMCDDYCIWPIDSSDDDILELHCQECPLNNINCDDYWEKKDDER
jgi:hypothetical protein